MKTALEHKSDEILKQLFHQLFEFQHKLERYNTELNDSEIDIVVEKIDQILEKLLNSRDA